MEIPCFDLFEHKQAAAAGASIHHHDEHEIELETPAQPESSSSAAGRSSNSGNKDSSLLDSDIATTASEVARAQNRNGELVKMEDLKYCFRVQKQIYLEAEAEK